MKKFTFLILAICISAIALAQPTITQDPEASPQLCEGGDMELVVAATGSGTLSYQWQVYYGMPPLIPEAWYDLTGAIQTELANQGIVLDGNTNDTLTATNLSTDFDGLQLRCKVSDAGGDSFSGQSVLTINPQPVVSNTSDTLCESSAGSGTADVDLTAYEGDIYSGAGTLTWYEDSFKNTLVATPTNVTAANNSEYYLEVDDGTCTNMGQLLIAIKGSGAPTPYTSEICEDAGTPGTAAGVDITSMDNTIDPVNPISWYSDNTYSTAVPDPTNVTVNDADVFYAEITGTGCPAYATLTYTVSATIPSSNQAVSVCEDAFGSGTGTIDLGMYNQDVNNGTGNTVEWYSDMGRSNSVASANDVGLDSDSIFYAKITSGNCSSEAELAVTINALPDVEVDRANSLLDVCDQADISIMPTLSSELELVKNKYRVEKDGQLIESVDETNALNILSRFPLSVSASGTYVFITENRNTGCIRTDTFDVFIETPDLQEISLVTYDLTEGKYSVVWDVNVDAATSTFSVSDGSGGSKLGDVSYSNTSLFLDDASVQDLTEAPTYALSAVDSCSNFIESTPHTAMLVSLTPGNGEVTLEWNDYVGISYTEFSIHRGTAEDTLTLDDTANIIATVTNDAGTVNTWIDTDPPVDTTVYYMVSIQLPTTVDIQNKKANSGPFSRSLSNLEDNRQQASNISSLEQAIPASIFPNPAGGITTISYTLQEKAMVQVEILNLAGQQMATLVQEHQLAGNQELNINIKELGLENGMYVVKVSANDRSVAKKLVIK